MVGAQFSLILHSEDNNSGAWAIISVEWLAEQYETQSNRRSFDCSENSANNRLASVIFCLHTCPAWKWEEKKQIIKRNKDKEDNDTMHFIRKVIRARLQSPISLRFVVNRVLLHCYGSLQNRRVSSSGDLWPRTSLNQRQSSHFRSQSSNSHPFPQQPRRCLCCLVLELEARDGSTEDGIEFTFSDKNYHFSGLCGWKIKLHGESWGAITKKREKSINRQTRELFMQTDDNVKNKQRWDRV